MRNVNLCVQYMEHRLHVIKSLEKRKRKLILFFRRVTAVRRQYSVRGFNIIIIFSRDEKG